MRRSSVPHTEENSTSLSTQMITATSNATSFNLKPLGIYRRQSLLIIVSTICGALSVSIAIEKTARPCGVALAVVAFNRDLCAGDLRRFWNQRVALPHVVSIA